MTVDNSNNIEDIEKLYFRNEPMINTIPKSVFENRIKKVFKLAWKTLKNSFGPYGASTFICSFPNMHVTKDGYTIGKNLSMNSQDNIIDQAILDIILDICGRLNYSVGDGTTTAVMVANAIYEAYLEIKDDLKKIGASPRLIMEVFEKLKVDINEELMTYVKKYNPTDDMNEYLNMINNVAYISSNGNKMVSNLITELYHELKYPAVSCKMADDGKTKIEIIEGFRLSAVLNDKLYINSDDKTMKLDDADVIIFGCKITKNIYSKILIPLNNASAERDRHLIVLAPSYDEVLLSKEMQSDFNREYRSKNDVNMVVMTFRYFDKQYKQAISDFAVLANTSIITLGMADEIIKEIDKAGNVYSSFEIDTREIPSLTVNAIDNTSHTIIRCKKEDISTNENYTLITETLNIELSENYIPLGFVRGCSLGLDSSIFNSFYFNKNMYQALLEDAKYEMTKIEDKYKKLGTFNFEVSEAQERFYSLNLKMGVFHVGADSTLTQKMLKDAVDDAVLACASAAKFGVVHGCGIDLINSIEKLIKKASDNHDSYIEKVILNMLKIGFENVIMSLFENSFTSLTDFKQLNEIVKNRYDEKDEIEFVNDISDEERHNILVSILKLSEKKGVPFDVVNKDFNENIINSYQTDYEILRAVIDLISILINENQLVVTSKHNFVD